MKSVTMLELRQDAAHILKQVKQGQPMILTYRGQPAIRLEPIADKLSVSADDPFYSLAELANSEGDSLTNTDMDRIIYDI